MKYIKPIILIVIMVCLDRLTKVLVVEHLPLNEYHPILGDFFGFMHIKNRGMGFGLFQGRQILFLVFTIIILCILAFAYFRMINTSRYLPLRLCIISIISGALGNMVDRVGIWNQYADGSKDALFQGAVTDFLYIKVINFPIFNVADMYVTVAVFIMILLLFIKYKDEDFKQILSGGTNE